MCGVAGILGRMEQRKDTMKGMLQIQRHRGPDAEGIWSDANIILGHNRLSIIDLSNAANQPMLSSCGRYVIVFNGEIYNYLEIKQELQNKYQFNTNSDTEVILNSYKAWGISMLNRFIGMFAFALWDKQDQKLLLVRDRFGVKPMYYTFKDNTLVFASEIKTLWTAGTEKQVNLKVWANYFDHGSYGLPDETFWKGIHQLPGGHYIELNYNEEVALKGHCISLIRWYDFVRNIENTPNYSLSTLNEIYSQLLADSIKLRFRSDVPVGFNISGGLDSSILLSQVKRFFPHQNSIQAFTFYTGHPDYDELTWVKQMISQTGCSLNTCLLKPDEVPALFDKVSLHEDEPFGGVPTLAYSKIFAKAKENGIKVLLDGQGMDEAWAGYDYYRSSSDATIQGVNVNPFVNKVMKESLAKHVNKDTYPKPFESELQNKQFRDLLYTKIPRALRFNDRISMMYSTELREPFLDHRLVELAFAQPDQVKLSGDSGKALLRVWANEWMGKELSVAPKRPLQTPQREWMGHELKPWVKSQLSLIPVDSQFLDSQGITEAYEQYCSGEDSSSFHLWQWISFSHLSSVKIDIPI